jgi:hypothetical protein
MSFADTLAWAQAQAPGTSARVLVDAYLTGTTRVSVDGRTVEYRSMAEIERALLALHAAGLPESQRRPRLTIAQVGDRNGGW